MSGAAAIAAAKNRRGRSEPNQKQLPPPISCGKNGNGSCPPQKNTKNTVTSKTTSLTAQAPSDLVDPTSLQILGPLPPVQILRLHEQRLNKFDDRLTQLTILTSGCQAGGCIQTQQSQEDGADLDDCFTRLETLESKIGMLEEVIMTLQNKLTIAQNFAMETNMSMTALVKKQELLQMQQTHQAQQTNIDAESDKVVSGQSSPITLEIIEPILI